MKNAREWALEALKSFDQTGAYLEEHFEKFGKDLREKDKNFAKELTYGTMRMQRLLDWWGDKLSEKGKLRLKNRDRWLFRLAFYEKFFMQKPEFATVNEWVGIAKKTTNSSIAAFLNALLRKSRPELPEDLALKHSYPDFFVEKLQGVEKDLSQILEAMNLPPKLMAHDLKGERQSDWIAPNLPVVYLEFSREVIEDTSLYIQNATPVGLLSEMLLPLKNPPKSVLDLAAAPGGKLIHAAKKFPSAAFTANEPNPKRLDILQQNVLKYGLNVKFSSVDGRQYPSSSYDLIILDAPCSNSGVLNKRPEARWRLNEKSVADHSQLQKELLGRALDLMTEGGHVIYLTCSIISEENEKVVEEVIHSKQAKLVASKKVLPEKGGIDGGFAALISR